MAKRKTKTSKAAVFAVIMSLLCVVAVVFMALTKCFTDFRIFKRTQSSINANADTLYAPDAGLLISQQTSDGIMLYSAATPFTDFETYSLDENVEAVKTITARFAPADTTLQKVDYAAAWKSAASAWATGKNVNDYITLNQSADGSLDCAVSLKDAIGEQIIITCTARPLEEGDWVPSATCTVDYYKRHHDCQVRFEGTQTDDDEEQGEFTYTRYNYLLGANTVKYVDEYAELTEYYIRAENFCSVTPVNGTGTIFERVNNSTVNVTVRISDSAAAKIKSAAGVSNLQSYQLVKNGVSNGLLIKTAVNNMLGGAANVSNRKNAIYTAFKEIYDQGQKALTFEVSYTTETAKTEYTFAIENLFNPLALGVKAEGIEIDKPGIIF